MIRERNAREIRIHPLVKVFSAGKEVRDGVCCPRNVFQRIVEVLQELDPTGLPARHLLWLTEVLQIFVVCEDPYRVLRTEEKGAATFETENDASKLPVVNVVIAFGGDEAARVKRDRVHAVYVFLCYDDAQRVTRRIGMHDEGFRPIRRFEDWFACAYFLQPLECLFAFHRPVPLPVFTCEIVEWSRNVRKVGYEGSVKVTEAQETPDVLYTGGVLRSNGLNGATCTL